MARQGIAPKAGSFATRLRTAQDAAGLTNEQLARKARLGVRLLQKYRAGEVQPRRPNLERLERALGQSLS